MSHHLALIGIVGLGLWGIIAFSYDPWFQSIIVISLSVGFVWWGLVHHWLHEGAKIGILLEYLAIALLGAGILLSVIWSR
ncbi:MAG: hypothetical protein AAB599_01910 [Patescibacteria group bacterium]